MPRVRVEEIPPSKRTITLVSLEARDVVPKGRGYGIKVWNGDGMHSFKVGCDHPNLREDQGNYMFLASREQVLEFAETLLEMIGVKR